MKQLFFILIGSSLASACAGEKALRTASSESAQIVNQYRSGMNDFAASQNSVNDANAARLQRLADLAGEREREIRSRRMAWQLSGDEESIRRLEVVGSRDGSAVLAEMERSRPPVASGSAHKFDPAPADALIKQLVVLQRPVELRERALRLLKFGSAVQTALDTSVEDAAAESTEAATATNAATADVTTQNPQP